MARITHREERMMFRIALLEEALVEVNDSLYIDCKHQNLTRVDADEILKVNGINRQFNVPCYVCPGCGVSLETYQVEEA